MRRRLSSFGVVQRRNLIQVWQSDNVFTSGPVYDSYPVEQLHEKNNAADPIIQGPKINVRLIFARNGSWRGARKGPSAHEEYT